MNIMQSALGTSFRIQVFRIALESGAASPTAAQQTAARNEAWKKTGLLAG